MIVNFLELPVGPEPPTIVNAIIEIASGSSNKYEYDKNFNIFKLDRTLFSPVHYPGAYGFIPRTHAEDDDPLDILVLLEGPTYPGTLVEVRPVGVLEMRDEKGLDHKILGVPVSDPRKAEILGLQDVPRHTLKEVDYFFHIYKDLEGKFADTYGWLDRMESYRIIEDCMKRYDERVK